MTPPPLYSRLLWIGLVGRMEIFFQKEKDKVEAILFFNRRQVKGQKRHTVHQSGQNSH